MSNEQLATEAPPEGSWTAAAIPSRPGQALGGAVIQEVILVNDWCGVYITTGDNLTWLVEVERCVDAERSVASAVDLMTRLKSLPISKSTRRRGLKIIGTALHEAFMRRTADDRRDFFKSAREFVTLRQREALQMNYFAMALLAIVVAVLGLLLLVRIESVAGYAIAGIMGGVGAFVSVAQRFRSIPIDRYSSLAYTALGGISRILFGIIFGGLLRLMQEAGLVLNLASNDPALLALASFVAGFSERLIPDLLQQFEGGLSEPGQEHDVEPP